MESVLSAQTVEVGALCRGVGVGLRGLRCPALVLGRTRPTRRGDAVDASISCRSASEPTSRRAWLVSASLIALWNNPASSFAAADDEGSFEVIYDKGTKLRDKTLSTRYASSQGGESSGEAVSDPSSNDPLEATLNVPDRWKVRQEPEVDTGLGASTSRYTWTNFTDPITGDKIIERASVAVLAAPKDSDGYLDGVYQAGTIEAITKNLPSNTLSKLDKADIFRASTRQDNRGTTYYDWELAATPDVCSEEERKLLGLCPYKRITLLSVATMEGKLVTLSLDCDVTAFQRYEKDIRTAIKSFSLSKYPLA